MSLGGDLAERDEPLMGALDYIHTRRMTVKRGTFRPRSVLSPISFPCKLPDWLSEDAQASLNSFKKISNPDIFIGGMYVTPWVGNAH